jgi:4-hydroxy-2-oxoheptanedioate aldolase
MKLNKTKAKLRAGETVFGCFTRYPDPALVEFLGHCGWDFVVIDAEHGTIEPRDCENMVRAAELRDLTPLVRVTTNNQPIILRYLDTGAQGVHVPMINTAEDAESAIQSVKYQPRGSRGLAGVRASGFGQLKPFEVYVTEANAETLVVAHIETKESIENLSGIIKVKDVDVIYLGPTDLSQSLGVPGQSQHPKVLSALEAATEIVKSSDKILGMWVRDAEQAREWQARGAKYIAIGVEGMLRLGCRVYLEAARIQ